MFNWRKALGFTVCLNGVIYFLFSDDKMNPNTTETALNASSLYYIISTYHYQHRITWALHSLAAVAVLMQYYLI